MNLFLLIITGIVLVALVAFLVWQNRKDKDRLEKKLNQDYPKPRQQEGDIDIEDRDKH